MRLIRIALVVVASLAALLVLAAVVLVGRNFAQRPGRVVYVGGPVITMDETATVAEGVALDGERIARVGSEAAIRAWAAENDAEIVELRGRAVLPGFIDAHGHFPGEGLFAVYANLNSPPIGEIQAIEDLVEAMSGEAADVAAGEWVLGMAMTTRCSPNSVTRRGTISIAPPASTRSPPCMHLDILLSSTPRHSRSWASTPARKTLKAA